MAIDKNHDITKFVVAQSNELVEANYSSALTARAHKTARLILSLINPNDQDLNTYTVKIDALKQYLGMKVNGKWGAFYDELKDISLKLNKEPIEISKDKKHLVANFISAYEIDKLNGTITFEVSSLLKPYLLELKKNYTSYLLAYIPQLRSVYSIRLYELLHQYRKIGKRRFELSDLQKKVGSKYKLYGDFKRKVLLQAQKDLKLRTDLAFIFQEIKTVRKVTHLEFVIFGNTPSKKESNQLELSFLEDAIQVGEPESPAYSENLVKAIKGIGISEQNIAKYLSIGFALIEDEVKREAAKNRCQNISEYFLEKLQFVSKSKAKNAKNNIAGFFIQALKEDWQDSKEKKKESLQRKSSKIDPVKKRAKQIEKLILETEKEIDRVENPIYSRLMANEETLNIAYDRAIKKTGNFFIQTHRELFELPIKKQYDKNQFLKIAINNELRSHSPNEFMKSLALKSELDILKKEFGKIQKQY